MTQDVEAAVERLKSRTKAAGVNGSPSLVVVHQEDVTGLIADHERLKEENGRDPAQWLERIRIGNEFLFEAETKLEAAEARCARLEGALKPFADAAEQFRPDDADTMRPAVVQAVHFREARAALTQSPRDGLHANEKGPRPGARPF